MISTTYQDMPVQCMECGERFATVADSMNHPHMHQNEAESATTHVPASGRAALTLALRNRAADVQNAREVLSYARLLRTTGSRPALVAQALDSIVGPAVRCVRISDTLVHLAARDLSLCPCGTVSGCKCVAPF